jgi:hypothetical protein
VNVHPERTGAELEPETIMEVLFFVKVQLVKIGWPCSIEIAPEFFTNVQDVKVVEPPLKYIAPPL